MSTVTTDPRPFTPEDMLENQVTMVEALELFKDGAIDASTLLQFQARHRASRQGGSIKVSQKGAVSVYGLQRMPVTLYRGQWERLLGMADEIKEFIKLHESELAVEPSRKNGNGKA